jgi:hypothetical protein
MATVHDREDDAQHDRADDQPLTGAELVQLLQASGVVGLWKDRDDIGDSVEYARKLREHTQIRT